jgi:hypothetical protein
MNALLHTTTRRLGLALVIPAALAIFAAGPALAKARPAASFYKPQDLARMSASWASRGGVFLDRPAASFYKSQDLQRMSDSWAARGGVFTNVPASSFYTPQQIETMSQSWAARGGLLPASAKPKPTTVADGFDWGDFGIGAAAMLGLVLLGAGLVAGAHYGRRSGVRARPAA